MKATTTRTLNPPPFQDLEPPRLEDLIRQLAYVFREEMVDRGISEFFIWSRGELEDMLFQARNDHLLFAYFNLSLRPRQRSLAAAVRSEIAKKKQISALLDADTDPGHVFQPKGE